ncbi:efflux RND transporter periplasmic adaptor subunit [Undibacterium sp. Ji42W]|uniref:efflux RND transporter periplasmic adaptor subunit n=1 Tax=Undibacterium sp. Ji42W TaxID=3413039 RepID=UPI003BF11D5D
MKIRHILLVTVTTGLLAGAAYVMYQLGKHEGMQNSLSDKNTSLQDTGASKKALYWHDPMVPGQKFDKPGKSPFMDMQLVPVYADNADTASENSVSINPRIQQNLAIRTASVVVGKLNAVVQTVGSVAYNERDVAVLQARSNGFVEKLYVRAPLDLVRKGQPLAELYVPDWIAAQEEFLAVKRMQGQAIVGLLDAARQRMRLAGMTDEQIHTVESIGKLHARITITAPLSGVMTELSVREGMTVSMGTPMFRINGVDTIWVNADIPESMAHTVQAGNMIEARTVSLPGVVFHGKVATMLPQVDSNTRTVKARIELVNPGSPGAQLLPGMFTTLNFAGTARKESLLVPSEALISTGVRNVVILAQDDGRFLPVNVEVGAESNDQTEIIRGLQAGQKVVASGQFLIDSEASLKASITRMEGATSAISTPSLNLPATAPAGVKQ